MPSASDYQRELEYSVQQVKFNITSVSMLPYGS